MLTADVLEGTVNAPEFPAGLDWLNTSTPTAPQGSAGQVRAARTSGRSAASTACTSCRTCAKLETKYSQELVVIGVHSAKFQNEKDTSQIRSAILRYEIRHPVVNDSAFESLAELRGQRLADGRADQSRWARSSAQFSGEGVYEPFDSVLSAGHSLFREEGPVEAQPGASSRWRKPGARTRC